MSDTLTAAEFQLFKDAVDSINFDKVMFSKVMTKSEKHGYIPCKSAKGVGKIVNYPEFQQKFRVLARSSGSCWFFYCDAIDRKFSIVFNAIPLPDPECRCGFPLYWQTNMVNVSGHSPFMEFATVLKLKQESVTEHKILGAKNYNFLTPCVPYEYANSKHNTELDCFMYKTYANITTLHNSINDAADEIYERIIKGFENNRYHV